MKRGGENQNNENGHADEESKGPGGENLRQQIRELSEKLIFANETIAMMEEETETLRAANH